MRPTLTETSLEGLLIRLLVGLIGLIIVIGLGFLIVRLTDIWWQIKAPKEFYEITPPVSAGRSISATQQLLTVLYGLIEPRWPFGFQPILSLEIVSARQSGIRFIVAVDKQRSKAVLSSLLAYQPDVIITKVEDYLPEDLSGGRVIHFKQAAHFALPLSSSGKIKDYDFINYLTEPMEQLNSSETVALQLVISPARPRQVNLIKCKLLAREDILEELARQKMALPRFLFDAFGDLVLELADGVLRALTGILPNNRAGLMSEKKIKSNFERQLMQNVEEKLNQPLLRVELRVVVNALDGDSTEWRLQAFRAALGSLASSHQTLKMVGSSRGLVGRYRQFSFKKRLMAVFQGNSCYLSVNEVAGLYHFPKSSALWPENLVKSLSRALPVPPVVKAGIDSFDVLLGNNAYHGQLTPIGLTEGERQRHVYIIGATGSGKSTMLFYSIIQDINAGKGLAVVDPHGDLASKLLSYIPKQRMNDVIYFNPDDIKYPIGLNLLELPDNLAADELLREKDLVTEAVISVFRKLFSDDDSGGHRIEYILRNTIQTALTVSGATLFTIYDLLNDPVYRRGVVACLDDDRLRIFWSNEFEKAGSFQQVKMVAGITAKVGRFLFSTSAKRVLEQPKSSVDFDDILNSGKILICNFSKGLLGDDTSTLFGTTVLAKLQIATLRRARIEQVYRRPFYLYVDEFQNFATVSFVQMLSEARKYALSLTIAEQSTAQQEPRRLVDIILANVGTVISFRSGSPVDERLFLPLYSPHIEAGEIANLPAYNFYVKLAGIEAVEPLSGRTVIVNKPVDTLLAREIISLSRLNYARVYREIPKVRLTNNFMKMSG